MQLGAQSLQPGFGGDEQQQVAGFKRPKVPDRLGVSEPGPELSFHKGAYPPVFIQRRQICARAILVGKLAFEPKVAADVRRVGAQEYLHRGTCGRGPFEHEAKSFRR